VIEIVVLHLLHDQLTIPGDVVSELAPGRRMILNIRVVARPERGIDVASQERRDLASSRSVTTITSASETLARDCGHRQFRL
jgi:hypothetical protein